MTFRWLGKSQDGTSVTLKRLAGCPIQPPPYATSQWMHDNKDLLRWGAVVDLETTGLSHENDSIIEIGLRQFTFNRATGEVLSLGKSYNSFQDPGRPLTPEIQQLTGITDAMLQDQQIDWVEVDLILAETTLVIAHNARFDRPFVDRHSKISPEKIWGCSLKHIDWGQRGFTSSKLELLNIYHGFFTDSHRALNDVDALLYLLSLPDTLSPKPYLEELLRNARRPMSQVVATAAPFDSKDFLKSRSYNWDNTQRVWTKIIFKDDVPSEIQWLEERVYFGPFRGVTRDIALVDSFKN